MSNIVEAYNQEQVQKKRNAGQRNSIRCMRLWKMSSYERYVMPRFSKQITAGFLKHGYKGLAGSHIVLEGWATREGANLIAIGKKCITWGNLFALFATRMLGQLSALTSMKRNEKTQCRHSFPCLLSNIPKKLIFWQQRQNARSLCLKTLIMLYIVYITTF